MNEFNYTSWMQQNRVGPYGKMNLKENGTGDAPFDFNKAAIESATGDKISHTEEDDYGRPIYWSTKNPNVTYYINDDDQIIKYDGETGERYPIGDLRNYDDPDFDVEPDTDADYEEPVDRNIQSDYDDGEFWESTNVLKEQDGDNQFTTEVTVDVVFDKGAVYEGKELEGRFYSDATTIKIKYLIDMELRSWGLKDVTVYAPTGDPTIEFDIEVKTEDDETDLIPFKGTIDWSKVAIEKEYGQEGYLISPDTIELQFDKDCKFVQGTVTY
jgi:hypothetical protein